MSTRVGIRGWLPLLGAVLVCGAIAAVGLLHETDVARGRAEPNQTQLILRLSDLPLGHLRLDLYEEQGERILCERLQYPDGTPAQMARFAKRFRPRGCLGAYFRFYTPPGQLAGPVFVGTGVLAMKSGRAAAVAWHVAPEILGRLTQDHPPREVPPPGKVGSKTRLFHTDRRPLFYPIFNRVGPATSYLVWRSGNTLAAIMAIGDSFSETDRAVLELAPRQQAHILNPTRYKRSERFDGEVLLDDPGLTTPVYWLGRNFRPGNGLPENRLFRAFGLDPTMPDEMAPGSILRVEYQNIRLSTWTPETWPRYMRTPAARSIVAWRCTKTRTIELPNGTATIYAGYAKNYRRCPSKPRRAFTAHVRIGDLIIAVNPIWALAPDFIEVVNPYGSFKGMAAIVRGLKLRPGRFAAP